MSPSLIVTGIVVALIIVIMLKSIALIPQGEAAVIERLGKYTHTVSGGLTLLVPFIDRIRAKVDIREQVVSFPPQAVITKDNLTVAIDTVVTFQINDAAAAIYGVNDYLVGVEQVSTATLRDVVGGMMLEDTLTSRETINQRLRGELDTATTNWGLRIARVELKAIDPPPSIQKSMELQMRAEREKRAMILTAEGQRESDIRTAEGEKQSKILSAEGEKHARILAAEAERQAEILRAEGSRAAAYIEAQGKAKAIMKVSAAIRSSQITPEVLAYQYLETLPELAKGDANKTWMIPTQFGDSLQQFARSMGSADSDGVFRFEPAPVDEETKKLATEDEEEHWLQSSATEEIAEAVAQANAEAAKTVDQAAPTNSLGQ
ncbi:SPFH/Band 7/PHB domain protein [Corynebacterium sp. 320]|uniref:SPFH/Band 7/PHB domain protein n=1 Tax=Corynebacterium zhongnanshanii TaxID=2768834 RepID=A0ABQ6VGQ6_9CORY|nr:MULTISPECIES: SPFH domain-containing protein [Corynebacterium]KAB1503650.1 SPFH/Band 7/PHB domain protein [Corynebacterium sp. 320]KAB1553249.1 SPFH/Band 7/PHB domain protein [Corynebacterium sp. 321]KAB1553532.1 SPFH/Band 7/PHB domain protein [Corynebacterium sp. 319]KAB3523498.1 SPFH/Band 7/PHB domain protein [Corynebacterium zhongnanshanii]KAB3527786.1 SPFH/Band 7/PHB domain protein [Corynebacterium sp. 250]